MSPYGWRQQPEPALPGHNAQNGYRPLKDQTHKTTFKGVIPGVEANCTGLVTLEVVFGSPDNFRSEELIFDIVPFRSGYDALLGRTAFARFNAVPHYAYLKLKMPGLRRVITVNGNTERSLRTEEHTAALAAEAQSSLIRQTANSAKKTPDTLKRVRSTPQADRQARFELDEQFGLRPSPSQVAKLVPRVHNYALKIPWA